MIKIDLSGKFAVVTAGASGIGYVIAKELIKGGAKVAVCDVDSTALESAQAEGMLACTADVGNEDEVARFFSTVSDTFGKLDILVNNAGISGPTQPLEKIERADWERTMQVNVTGQFFCAKQVVPLFKRQRSGVIINMSSTAGRMGMPLRSAYCASKYAVRGLTDALAVELGEFNVRVNAVLPGMVEGQRLARVVAEQAANADKPPDEYLRMMLHNVSMHSLISPDEIASVVAYLASDHAKHITGQSISVCGNLETYRGPFLLDRLSL
jgi:NAD(P)-dependent dehydrogenase (short-subunit alcohol dehydrogenase family)